MNKLQLGYIDKNVIRKNFTKLLEFNLTDLKNYSLSPRGGSFEIDQDLISDTTQQIITYCIFQLGNCQFWAFCELTGFSNGYYIYAVTTDALTTAFKNSVFDNAHMTLAYSSINAFYSPYIRDNRRMLSIEKTVKTYKAESIDEFIMQSASQGCVCMQVAIEESRLLLPSVENGTIKYAQGGGNSPCNVVTYIFNLLNFSRLWYTIRHGGLDADGNTVAAMTQAEQAAFLKSILQIYYLPINYLLLTATASFQANFKKVNRIEFSSTSSDNAYSGNKIVNFFYRPSTVGNLEGVSYQAYATNDTYTAMQTNSKFIYVSLPDVTIPQDINKYRGNNMQITYLPYFCNPVEISPQFLNTTGDTTISMRIYLDFAGAQWYSILYIDGIPMPQCNSSGLFSQTFPAPISDSISNFAAAKNQAYINTGLSVIGSLFSAGAGLATGNIGALAASSGAISGITGNIKSISDISTAQSASGHIMGTAGTAGTSAYTDISVTVSYNDYATMDSQWIYGAPCTDAAVPMSLLADYSGYIQISDVHDVSYSIVPKSIIDDAITQLKNGAFTN